MRRLLMVLLFVGSVLFVLPACTATQEGQGTVTDSMEMNTTDSMMMDTLITDTIPRDSM
ncbi:MAG: hypothetical protein WKF68_13370 [Daejeonella sp.]